MALIISETTKVEAGTDFYIEVSSITDRDGTALDLELAPFYLEFFGASEYAKIVACKELSDSEKYIVSFDGTDRVNNIYTDGVLRLKFENYPICSSKVYYRQIENYTNSDFDDGTETIYTTPTKALPITISPTGGNSMTSNSAIQATITLGALKGEKGDPYELTNEDKQDIAEIALEELQPTVDDLKDYISERMGDPYGMRYTECTEGAYIVGDNNLCYTEETWAKKASYIEAIGIGVIHADGAFILGNTSVVDTTWDKDLNGVIVGCSAFSTSQTEDAKNTFDGWENTNAIVAINSDTSRCAAAHVRYNDWGIDGKIGYLGSYGEFNILNTYYDEACSLSANVFGKLVAALVSDIRYWTSTQVGSNAAWIFKNIYGSREFGASSKSQYLTPIYSTPFFRFEDGVTLSNEYATKEYVDEKIKTELPTKTSDLTNDSEFTTLAKVLESVYSKSETLTTNEVKALIAIVQGELDTLVGGDASTAIDSYNEIIAFLSSFTDSEDLASVLLALKNEIVALIPDVPDWALSATKPTYSASEVGALPDTTVVIPEAPQDGKKYVRTNNEWVEEGLTDAITEWNFKCGAVGTYNTETKLFELYDWVDIESESLITKTFTLEEAKEILIANRQIQIINICVRTMECPCEVVLPLFERGLYDRPAVHLSHASVGNNLNLVRQIYLTKGGVDYSANCTSANLYYGRAYGINFLYAGTSVPYGANSYTRRFRFYSITSSLDFSAMQNLWNESILYNIQVATPTTDITFTLHANAYARAIADQDILDALDANELITLTSA